MITRNNYARMKISLPLLFLGLMVDTDAFATKKKPAGTGFGGGNTKTLTHTPDTSDSTQGLLQFLTAQKSRGLKDVEIGFSETTGVRGLFATKNFKKGQIMCQIPSDCALALSDPSKNGEDAPTLTHGGANFLSMYWDNDQARKLWAPYLNTLPVQGSSQFDPTPDFFDEQELQLFEFPRLIRQAKSRKEDIEKFAAETSIEKDRLQFATWLTASRAFSISLSTESDEEPKYDEKGQVISKAEKKTIRVMVPFIGRSPKCCTYSNDHTYHSKSNLSFLFD